MERSDVKNIIIYYKNIPEMLEIFLKQHRELCNTYYNSARAINIDGMPHGTSVSNPSEVLGIKAAESNASEMIREIEQNIRILEADHAFIRRCLDQINGKYKKLVIYKLLREYNWAKISYILSEKESTCRYRFDIALDRLGEQFDEYKNADELKKKALRAR